MHRAIDRRPARIGSEPGWIGSSPPRDAVAAQFRVSGGSALGFAPPTHALSGARARLAVDCSYSVLLTPPHTGVIRAYGTKGLNQQPSMAGAICPATSRGIGFRGRETLPHGVCGGSKNCGAAPHNGPAGSQALRLSRGGRGVESAGRALQQFCYLNEREKSCPAPCPAP